MAGGGGCRHISSMLSQAMAGGSRGSGLPATRLPTPSTWSGLNAGMRGNGGQVAMAVCDFGPMTSRRWRAGDAGGRQGGLVLAWDLFRIYAFPCQLNFFTSVPILPTKIRHRICESKHLKTVKLKNVPKLSQTFTHKPSRSGTTFNHNMLRHFFS